MTQDKLRRIITACVVAGTTLLVVLLSVLIFQWVKLGVLNKRINKVSAENATWQQMIDEGEEKAKYYENGTGKFWLALEKGWVVQGE
jgi:hypothetical protein